MNNLYNNTNNYTEPFDHIICDNFLKNYELYNENYPTQFLSDSIRMHKDLTFGDFGYENIYSTEFKKLHEYVYEGSFIEDFLNIFKKQLEKRYEEKELLHNPINLKIFKKPYELRNFINEKKIEDSQDLFLFPRIDFGIGYSGYGINNGGRGVHTDNITRLISVLLFFTNQEEIVGGEHFLHKVDENYNPKIFKTIEVKENRLIASIQSNNAYHSVNPLISGERKAVYMSVSCSKKIWSDYKDEKLKFLSKNRS